VERDRNLPSPPRNRHNGFGPSWHFEHAILREKLHRAIEVVSIEGRQHPLEGGDALAHLCDAILARWTYSVLMPAALMIGPHLSISALWNAASPTGVCCSRAAMT
jgi:hypothetical protein